MRSALISFRDSLAGMVEVIEHHRSPYEKWSKIHEPAFGTKFRRRELIQLVLQLLSRFAEHSSSIT